MSGVYDALDAAWSWRGDFLPSDTNDLKDTSEDFLLSLCDQLHIVCASALKDWEIYPNRGATLDDFIGEPNTRTTGSHIHDRLRVAITSAGLVEEEDLDIKVFPVTNFKVVIVIRVSAVPTAYNKISAGEKIQVSLVFDSSEQQVSFLGLTPVLKVG